MRGGGTGLKARIDTVRAKGLVGLHWTGFIAWVITGVALPETFLSGLINWIIGLVGDLIGTFVGWFGGSINGPLAAHYVVFLGLLVMFIYDLLKDGVPNRNAMIGAALLPTLALGVPGKLSGDVTQLAHAILATSNQVLGVWLGTAAPYMIVVAAGTVAVVLARRILAGR